MLLTALAAAPVGAAAFSAAGSAATPSLVPRATVTPPDNPFLADSAYPISHHNSAQNDSTLTRGPAGPTVDLSTSVDASSGVSSVGDGRLQHQFLGPAHFGEVISDEYPDGRRVIWSNGGDRIAKLDADTFEVLAELPLPGKTQWTEAEADEAIAGIEGAAPDARGAAAVALAARTLQGLAGVYAMIDSEGSFYVSGSTSLVVYGDAEPDDPASPIEVRDTWDLPPEVTGKLTGMNMTYDGRIVLVTDEGWVVAVTRDLSDYAAVRMLHSEGAAALNAERIAAGQAGGYGWVRNSYAVDEDGGIYIVSDEHVHKVVWTGERLSTDEADGAWSEPYSNTGGLGSGSTPVLMGFGEDDDRLIAFTDGDTVMNFTVYWRDEVPKDWKPPKGALSPRVAGVLPADMGDPDIEAIQTEQAPIVGGYGGLVVNNMPASIPDEFPSGRAVTLLNAYYGNDPAFTPYGVQKFEWDPKKDKLREAWVNTKVSSPNAVPWVSLGSNIAYTIGTRGGSGEVGDTELGEWTLEALDWRTGKSKFHYVLGGFQFDSLFSGVIMDDAGNIIYGGPFGKIRILRA